jgi:type IV secretory pathway VirD2 relaxase
MSDDDFTPKLGRMRTKASKRGAKYLGRIVAATKAAGNVSGARSRRFDGSRIGRGSGIARLLSSRDRLAAFRARRAVVKTRLVRLGARGIGTARAHLRYIQRDGVTREGQPGELYAASLDRADGAAFVERSEGDRHQFRFIVSAEDGAEYADLKPYIRRLMTQAEADLGTKLDWVAVDHFNTEHPHTHIMLRGVDDSGQNLVIARNYIAHGLRERAAELATLDLGPRTDLEIEQRLRRDVDQERLTPIDRRLLRRMDTDRIVSWVDRDPLQQSLAAGRLQRLQDMGLATDLGSSRYQLADGLDETLRRMSERGDIIRLMQREMTARGLEGRRSEQRIADLAGEPTQSILGRVIHRGLADEHQDRHFLMIDGIDGHVHYVGIGRGEATEATPENAIVRVAGRDAAAREVDRTIAAVAAAHRGRYTVDRHLQHDPSATSTFAEAHVRRLEAMRRAYTGVEREADGTWIIPADHVERAAAYEQRLLRDRPATVEILSTTPIERLPKIEAATWLDRELAADHPSPARDAGFGREVQTALIARQRWLIEQELADETLSGVRLRNHALATLQRRELLRVAGELSGQLGKYFAEAQIGDAIEGRLARPMDLTSGRFALVEKAHEFTLVPWRPALEKQLGQHASGIMRADGISWRFGRDRAGPEIS